MSPLRSNQLEMTLIKSRDDLNRYLSMDKANYAGNYNSFTLFRDDIFRWTYLLRYIELHTNCDKSFLPSPLLLIIKIWFISLSRALGFSIPINTCGPGLSIAHRGTIVINENAIVGENCRIHVCVNIGGFDGAPRIGNNVYIGPGAKIYGDIHIGNNVAIGANAVVNKSFPDNVTIGGIPAQIISEKGSRHIIPALKKGLSAPL